MGKFYEYIDESVWGDIRKQSNGSEVKQEDGIPPHLKEVLSRYINMFAYRCYYQGDYTAGSAPDFRAFVRENADNPKIKELNPNISELINYFEHTDNWNNVVLPLIHKAVEKVDKDEEQLADKLWDAMKDIDNVANESVWSDIRDRGNGVKKSEDIIHLDDKYVDKFKTCLRWFVESIVYCEKCENDFNDFKESVKTNSRRLGEVWKGNTTIPLSDILLPYIEDNWDQYDNIKKQIDDLVRKEEVEIRKLGFRREPGKTIEDTLCEWWNSLDDDKKYDIIMGWCEDDIMSRFYGNHLDDDEFTGEDMDVDYEWDRLDYLKQVKIYMEESKTNESVWGDIRKRGNGTEVKKEDDMTEDDFLMLRETAKMFMNVINSEVGKRNSMRVNGGKLFYIDDCDSFIKYILARKKEHFWNDVDDESYDKIIKFVEKNWEEGKGIQEFIDTYLSHLNECEGVPGGTTPADVGGMGAAYFPGPNGEPGSGDLPSPTGIVYHQVAPFGVFIKELKKKKKKKKFRKEDEPCSHSPNKKVYDYVDDYREYVDRTYTMMNRKK